MWAGGEAIRSTPFSMTSHTVALLERGKAKPNGSETVHTEKAVTTMNSSGSHKRTLEDDLLTDAQSAITKAKELDRRVPSGTLFASASVPKDAAFDLVSPPPRPERLTRIPLDPAYVRKREEDLRATGDILHQRCARKMERLNQVHIAFAIIVRSSHP